MHKSYFKSSTEDKSLLSCWNAQTHDSMKIAGTGTGFGEFIYLKRASRLFPPLEMEASLPVWKLRSETGWSNTCFAVATSFNKFVADESSTEATCPATLSVCTHTHTHKKRTKSKQHYWSLPLPRERDCKTLPSQYKLGIGICKTAYLEVSIWYRWTWQKWNHMHVLLPGSEGSCWMHCFEPGTWWPGCSPPYLHWHWRPCQPRVSHPSLTASLLHPTWRFPLHHSLQAVVQCQETTPRDLYNPASKKPAHETHEHPSQTSNYPIQ